MTRRSAHTRSEERRLDHSLKVSDYFHGEKVFYDPKQDMRVVKIFSGDWYVTGANEMLATVLGSCVAACVRDPVARVGGMNHFLLPGEDMQNMTGQAARYGGYAMESLINGILTRGGNKQRLEIKVFGGGNVINNSARIGSKNARFIRDYLQREGLRIHSHDLEGEHPRRVHYYPLTGKVMMRHLRRAADKEVADEEAIYQSTINKAVPEGAIELF